MTTSAQSLNQLLAIANKAQNPKDKFLFVLVEHLGLEGEDARAQVISILLRLIGDVETDIDALPVDDTMKAHLRRYVSPLNGLKDLTQIHMDIHNAKNHFLKADHLVGLTNVHLALTGHIERPALSKDAKELAESFNGLRGEIVEADLPESLKRVLLKRVSQIASILEHYYAFGAKVLEDELEGLVGALVVSAPQNASKSGPLYKKLAKYVATGFRVLTAVDAGFAGAVSIAENASKLIEFVEENTGGES
ncbi:hypothetical protein [Thalassovita sp.]|uniref:hypothetical protein n=1 Tax=Thalassovita sp. TaxID=1979401 RepID=UPI002B26EAB8|nr:hypothetical protein [Thalassovita sp.]